MIHYGVCEIMLHIGRVHFKRIILFSIIACFLLSWSWWHFDFPARKKKKDAGLEGQGWKMARKRMNPSITFW